MEPPLGPAILSFVERLSSFRGDSVQSVYNSEYFRLVLCWEVCPLSECPLLLYPFMIGSGFPVEITCELLYSTSMITTVFSLNARRKELLKYTGTDISERNYKTIHAQS